MDTISSRNTLRNSGRKFAAVFLLPSILFVSMVYVYPVISAVHSSFRDGTLINKGAFIGIQNYVTLFSMNKFYAALRFSMLFALVCVPIAYVFGLAIALLLNADIPCRGFFRAALLIPWIVPSVVSVVCWRWLVLGDGCLLNTILGWFGIGPIYFLSDGYWPFLTVCLIKIWKNFPFVAVSLLAALQTVDVAAVEASRIDGANAWQTFWHVKMPFIAPVSAVCLVLLTIWSYNDYDILRMLTNGGPLGKTTNMMIMATDYAFNKNNLGLSCAMAILSLILIMVVSQVILQRQK